MVTAGNDRTVCVWPVLPCRAAQGQHPQTDLDEGLGSDVDAHCDLLQPEPEVIPQHSARGDTCAPGEVMMPESVHLPVGSPPRTPPRLRHHVGAGASRASSSLSPLRTAAIATNVSSPFYKLRHTAQVPRARFNSHQLVSICENVVRVWNFAEPEV